MKRILKNIGLCIGFIASLLAIFEFIAKYPIFFRPLWFYLNQNIEIKLGIVLLLELLILLFLILWIYNNDSNIKKIRRLENKSYPAFNKELKTSFEEFPEEGILYTFEYPLGKEDVVPWIYKSDPRCLKCRTQMKKVPVNYNPFTPLAWICESCGHFIEDGENVKLQTQAKSRLVKRLNGKS